MDPLTHAATAAVVGRAGLRKLSPLAMAAVVIAGLAPDADLLGRLGGPRTYVLLRRGVTHSLLGALVLAALVAWILWRAGRRREPVPARLSPLLLAACLGASIHLVLDWGDSYGERLLWPFRKSWYVGGLWPQIDPCWLALLLLAVGVPWLLSLVGEEIGARPRRGVDWSAVVALGLLASYAGWRASLHNRAVALLESSTFHRAVPEAVEAFPEAYSPLTWRGVVSTARTFEVVAVPLAPGDTFDPDLSRTFYKPEESEPLKRARELPDVRWWLAFARFPLATVEPTEDGTRIEFRDLRFERSAEPWGQPVLRVVFDRQLQLRQLSWQLDGHR
jgi:membrane-bound metal-dependent hydrolase YbcI (DUF457 family)